MHENHLIVISCLKKRIILTSSYREIGEISLLTVDDDVFISVDLLLQQVGGTVPGLPRVSIS